MSEQYSIQSVHRACKILDCFLPEETELTLSQFCQKMQLHKSTVHRFVKSLEKEGFLEKQEGREAYRLGVKILQFSHIVLESLDIRIVARPFMQELSQNLGYMIFLSQVSGDYKLCIEKVGTRRGLQPFIKVGQIIPLYIGSSGWVLMAYMEEDKVNEILLSAFDSQKKQKEFKQKLQKIRKEGYAVGFDERIVGGAGISVPVFDYKNKLIASLTLVGQSEHIRDQADRLMPEIKKAAALISSRLGSSQT